MNKLYQFIMAGLAVALALLCSRQRDELRASAALPAPRHETAAPSQPLPSVQTQTVARAAAETRPSAAAGPGAVAESDLVSDLLGDPERLDQIRSIASPEFDQLYAALFRALGASPDEINAVKNMLMAKKIITIECGLRQMKARTQEEKDAIAEQQRQGLVAIDDKLRKELGADGYATYEGYEKSMPERTVLADYKQYLENRGDALTYEQEDGLIRLMYDERAKNRVVEALFSQSETTSIRDLGRPDEILRAYDAWQDQVRLRAASLLSAAQKPVFDEQLAYQRDALTKFLGDASH